MNEGIAGVSSHIREVGIPSAIIDDGIGVYGE